MGTSPAPGQQAGSNTPTGCRREDQERGRKRPWLERGRWASPALRGAGDRAIRAAFPRAPRHVLPCLTSLGSSLGTGKTFAFRTREPEIAAAWPSGASVRPRTEPVRRSPGSGEDTEDDREFPRGISDGQANARSMSFSPGPPGRLCPELREPCCLRSGSVLGVTYAPAGIPADHGINGPRTATSPIP